MSQMRHKGHQNSAANAGFTLLEVMIAVAILAVGMTVIFASEVQSVHTAAYARRMNTATLLARCKMGEIEEQIQLEGFPAVDDSGEDECCEDAETEGFTCEWSIDRVVLPDNYLEGEEEGSVANFGDEGAQTDAIDSTLAGAAMGGDGFSEMAIGIAFPVLKPAIEEQVRRASVTVRWDDGGSRPGSFDVVQYLVAEQAAVVREEK